MFSNMRKDFEFRNDFLKTWMIDNEVAFDAGTTIDFKPDSNGVRQPAFTVSDILNNRPTEKELNDPVYLRALEVFFFMVMGKCDDDDMRTKLFNEGMGWIRLNNDLGAPDGYTNKLEYFKNGNVATVIFFSSLMMSLLFYTTLAVSSAGETDSGLKHWMRFGGFAIFCCYTLMLVGMIYFFLSLASLSRVQFAWHVYGDWFETTCITGILLPLMLFTSVLTCLLFYGAAKETISNSGCCSAMPTCCIGDAKVEGRDEGERVHADGDLIQDLSMHETDMDIEDMEERQLQVAVAEAQKRPSRPQTLEGERAERNAYTKGGSDQNGDDDHFL